MFPEFPLAREGHGPPLDVIPAKAGTWLFFLGSCFHRNDTGGVCTGQAFVCHSRESGNPVISFWTAACAGMTPAGFLLAQEGHGDPLTRPAWTAGHPLPQGERRTGFLLMHEGHCGPLTRRCLGHRRPLPRWGEAYWTAACAGRTPAPACAGMTQWPPQPARPSALPPARPASPARGEADWIPDCAGMTYRPRRRPMCRSLAVAALFPSLG